jgi:E3 ubiquitin-protein ligase FANCL
LVLSITLPSKNIKNSSDTEFFIECGICYTYSIALTDVSHLELATTSTTNSTSIDHMCNTDSHVPDQVCSNPKCNRMYHFSCLVNWLQSIPTSKTSFGTLFGQCPYCNEPLSVQILR